MKDDDNNNNKILLVDDEPDLTLAFKLGLEDNGFEVDTFNDPLMALSYFKNKSSSYDLVLLDIKMPKMNGYEFSQKVKDIDNDVKICFLTASEDYCCNIVNHKQTRAEYFIRKPIGIDEFTKQINSILQ